MSVIANRQTEKFTDLFGYDWHQGLEGVGGPNMPMQTVALNMADLGRPPQPLSYYFGAAGWYCMNANPFALEDQPISAGLPPGMPCDTIFNDLYRCVTPLAKSWICTNETHQAVGSDPSDDVIGGREGVGDLQLDVRVRRIHSRVQYAKLIQVDGTRLFH